MRPLHVVDFRLADQMRLKFCQILSWCVVHLGNVLLECLLRTHIDGHSLLLVTPPTVPPMPKHPPVVRTPPTGTQGTLQCTTVVHTSLCPQQSKISSIRQFWFNFGTVLSRPANDGDSFVVGEGERSHTSPRDFLRTYERTHTMKEYWITLLRLQGFGCIEVLTFVQVISQQWLELMVRLTGLAKGTSQTTIQHSLVTNSAMSDASTTD